MRDEKRKGQIMSRYNKGARSERELLRLFSDVGFSVIRAAGSGVNPISPPDILVLKGEKRYALECKAWNKNRLAIDHEKYVALRRWEENTGIPTMVAWKIPYKGWLFIPIAEMERNPASYSITLNRAYEIGKKIEALIEHGGNGNADTNVGYDFGYDEEKNKNERNKK